MIIAYGTGLFCLVLLALNFISVGIAIKRAKPRSTPLPPPENAPAVSLVRPVCGIDNFCEETLGSSFRLDYPSYEVIFCVARANDPVVPVVQKLIAANPNVPAQLIIGDEKVSANPKLNNCVRGWDAARHEWIILADSNVLMPQDYIQRLQASWGPKTGLVCSMPQGSHPQNLWAEFEIAILNTYQARWQYSADGVGTGFAQGKNMLWRRDILEAAGGIRTPPRPSWCGAPASRFISSIALSSSHSASVHYAMFGCGRSAGRACDARHFRAITRPRFSQARPCRSFLPAIRRISWAGTSCSSPA
jgi:ceramide glucosyltransferase